MHLCSPLPDCLWACPHDLIWPMGHQNNDNQICFESSHTLGLGPIGDFSPFPPKLGKWWFCGKGEHFRVLDLVSLCEKGLKDIRTFNSRWVVIPSSNMFKAKLLKYEPLIQTSREDRRAWPWDTGLRLGAPFQSGYVYHSNFNPINIPSDTTLHLHNK